MTAGPSVSQQAVAAEAALQRELVFKRVVDDEARVFSTAFPLLGANVEFCDDMVRPGYGLSVWNIHGVERAYQPAAKSLYGLDERLIVKSVARKSPAQKAGLLSGDIIESVNDTPLAGRDAIKAFEKALEKSGTQPARLAMRRDGALRTVKITPVAVCNYPVRVDHNSSEVNAFADGRQIIVTRGMLRFVENDRELALVLAHELAHNALLHINKTKQNALGGALGGLLIDSIFAAGGISTGGQFSQLGADIGTARYSVAFEQEADYAGMYFMERAGYSARDVAQFWRRMAAESSASITARSTHPTSPERFLAIENTYREIQDKKNSGKKLAPNFTP